MSTVVPQMSTKQQQTTSGITKKHTRSRSRARRAGDPYDSIYGNLPWEMFRGRPWTYAQELDEATVGKHVLLFGNVLQVRPLSKTSAIVVLYNNASTVRCMVVANADHGGVTTRMVGFAATLPRGTLIDVEGVVSPPGSGKDLIGTTQKVEVQVRKLHAIGTLKDGTSQSSSDISITTRPSIIPEQMERPRMAGQVGQSFAHVDQRTSLGYGRIDLSFVRREIFRIYSEVEYKIMEYFRSKHFVGTHSHGIFAGSVEGGLAVLQPESTFLAQSSWLYNQMAICSAKRVFEIGPLFRHENSYCKMHTCEFIDLGAAMEIKEHYLEVCDVIYGLLLHLFKHLKENCKEELETISRRYTTEPLKYLEEALMLKYDEGIRMLKEAGTKVKLMGDLTNEHEQKLGRLVREKYGTDIFILYQHPSAVRPLYTMPYVGNPAYSNSFDVFFRSELVISGSQRIHQLGVFMKRTAELGYHPMDNLDFFRHGVMTPHGGFGACLYRVVMLFCGLGHS